MPLRVPALFALFCACMVFCLPASADEATEARFHFQRGVKLFQKGKVHEALEQFLKSNQLAKNHNAVFNAAKCFELIGQESEAFAFYQEYLLSDLTEDERLDGEEKLAAVKKNVATISITSSPPGADIYLDRKDLGSWGKTPRLIAVPAGNHEIVLELTNHHTAVIPVEAVIGETSPLEAELEPLTGTVHLTGPYDEASISVDGEELGTMPLPQDLDLFVGRRMIELDVEGMVPENRLVDVKAGETSHVSFVLAPLPAPQGTLYILSDPISALVKLDGQDFDFTPVIKKAPAGKHRLSVESESMKTWEADFEIEQADTLFLNVKLAPDGLPRGHKIGQAMAFGLGGLLVAAGIVTGSLAVHTRKELDRNPSWSLHAQGEALNLSTDIMLFSGGAALLTGLIWYLATRPIANQESSGQILGQVGGSSDGPDVDGGE